MEFNLKQAEAPVEKLIWQDMKQIDFKFNLPLLINRRGEVLLGNCLKKQITKKKSYPVIIVEIDNYMGQILKDLELTVVEENSIERYHAIQKELKVYINSFNIGFEIISLFDNEELKENGLITEENYIRPYTSRFKHLEG